MAYFICFSKEWQRCWNPNRVSVPERREVIVRKYKSAQANEICYAVLCVFSMVAAASPVSPPTSQGSTNRNSCASPSSPPSVRKQEISSITSNLWTYFNWYNRGHITRQFFLMKIVKLINNSYNVAFGCSFCALMCS